MAENIIFDEPDVQKENVTYKDQGETYSFVKSSNSTSDDYVSNVEVSEMMDEEEITEEAKNNSQASKRDIAVDILKLSLIDINYEATEASIGVDTETLVPNRLYDYSKGEFGNANYATKYFVYYNQDLYYDVMYGHAGTIQEAGCGPTSMAMVLSSLLLIEITPIEVAKYSVENNYRVETKTKNGWVGNGTNEGLFPSIVEKYGINCTKQNQTKENIINSLKNGEIIIAHMGKGEFTSSGHYIVISAINENNQVLVMDSNNSEHTGWYDPSIIEEQSKGSMYSFRKDKPIQNA